MLGQITVGGRLGQGLARDAYTQTFERPRESWATRDSAGDSDGPQSDGFRLGGTTRLWLTPDRRAEQLYLNSSTALHVPSHATPPTPAHILPDGESL